MPGTEPWSLGASILALCVCGVVLLVAGVRLTRVVDLLADRTGIGEAVAGAVLLGATTSLPGLVTTVVAGAARQADLAVSNAVGGIAAQTVFLAVADLAYRRANLEHAAASVANLLQTMVLLTLLSLVLVGATTPGLEIAGLHPVTLLLPAVYGYGLLLTRRARARPMWRPRHTAETRPDVPEEEGRRASLVRLSASFLALAAVVAATGWVVARAGLSLVARTELSGSVVGGLFTSVVTSLPELVTVLAAVRGGALTLAVGDIIGGNTFDVLFVAAGDLAYGEGSLYAAISAPSLFLLALTALLTSVLAAGLVYREERGIGFEGLALLVLYAAGAALLWTGF